MGRWPGGKVRRVAVLPRKSQLASPDLSGVPNTHTLPSISQRMASPGGRTCCPGRGAPQDHSSRMGCSPPSRVGPPPAADLLLSQQPWLPPSSLTGWCAGTEPMKALARLLQSSLLSCAQLAATQCSIYSAPGTVMSCKAS